VWGGCWGGGCWRLRVRGVERGGWGEGHEAVGGGVGGRVGGVEGGSVWVEREGD